MAGRKKTETRTRGGAGWLAVAYLAGVASTLFVLSLSGCSQSDGAEGPDPAPPPPPAAAAPAPPPTPAPAITQAPAAAPTTDADAAEKAQIAEDAAAAGMTSRTENAGQQ